MGPAVRFTWNMLYDCNYRCAYCFFDGKWEEYRKRNVYLPVDELMAHWGRIYEKYGLLNLIITGGEPFIYPNFIEIIKRLSAICFHINISSNSSGDLKSFVQELDPQKVSLSLSHHPQFDDLEEFIKRLLFIRKHQFNGCINLVAYPVFIQNIGYYQEKFAAINEPLKIIPFFGEYRQKAYPESYTLEEQRVIGIDETWFKKVKRHGFLCQAGQKTALIFPDGKVARCGQVGENMIVGNFFDDNFKLLDSPCSCQAEYCPCGEDEVMFKEEAKRRVEILEDKPELEKEVFVISPANVKFPPRVPPYRVQWNWTLGSICNYKCSYCPEPLNSEGEKLQPLDIKMWKDVWDRIFEKYWCCHIRFSGGEPTVYPGFFDLVKILLEKHTVNITTNLSFDVKKFVDNFRPEGLSIAASFHPEFSNPNDFLDKIMFLFKHGHHPSVAYVAYPPHLKQIQSVKSLFEKNMILFKIIPFNGEFQGTKYPESYTVQERSLLEGLSLNSSNSFSNDLNNRWYEFSVKKGKEDNNKKGKLCRMGQMYAKIFPDGRVVRCCALDKSGPVGILGYITDPDFHLLDKPEFCQAEHCPCFKSMLVGCEEEKWLPLWESTDHAVYKIEEAKKLIRNDAEAQKTVLVVKEVSDKPEPVPGEKAGVDLFASSGIQFTWDSHYKCNFRCPYCWFYAGWVQGAKRNVYLSVEEWMRHWKRIYDRYGKCHIAITGGEPFLYPNFINLVKQLFQIHSVKITTNMSGDIETFIKEIDPQKVILDLNFHPLFSNQEAFIKKTLLLKRAGFKAGVCYLAYPPQMKQIDAVRRRFESEEINFALAAFWGEYRGNRYPESYSPEDREMIRPFLGDIDRITYHLKGESPEGRLCNAGHKYAVIQADGKVIRCGPLADKIIGNFFDEEFRLLDTPRPCEAKTCPCNEYVNLLDAEG